ncbi:hypothetical protein [Pedobacter zeae]|uniref:Ribosomal protein L3 n=1 Tax=Pedobacter zeae TaxID=1737356 RepID=A0A7W6K9L0_9SPHI|nr:hypothetical protein [Pedobacter zeae]MBB4107714.1 ribosomal protein L3 [Pedobacter zeae]GGG97536.1 hypothetical protein GCM10007422_09380 [Pedobacter zeae]
MKPQQAKELIKSITERGWIEKDGVFYTPAQASALGLADVKTKKSQRGPAKIHSDQKDAFCHFVKLQLNFEIVMEYRFDKKRKWRFDYANEEKKIAIECEGGIWTGGRHTRGKGYQNDMEKYNAASLQGWTLIRRTPDQLITSETIDLIKSAIKIFN